MEIERKYLVAGDSYKSMAAASASIWQGYLSTDPEATVRLRIAGQKAFLTVKSKNRGATRGEWEYEIPLSDAEQMKSLCKACLEKRRYVIPYDGHRWEVDEFSGRHTGLTLAEIELKDEKETFTSPPFLGEEVTGDPKYYNSSISKL